MPVVQQHDSQRCSAATLHLTQPLAAGCRCQQLQLIVPRPLARWLKVLSQPWEGDVTMVLPSAYSQIKKAITNPTSADLQEACLQASDWHKRALGWHKWAGAATWWCLMCACGCVVSRQHDA